MNIRPIYINPVSRYNRLISDFLSGNESVREFLLDFPSISSLTSHAANRRYRESNRPILVEALCRQYQGEEVGEKTMLNIEALALSNSRTITTGHQLNLFTGPFFMISKICNAISLSEQMNQIDDGHVYVPVFWMASEDHDFDEINHTRFFGNEVAWNSDQSGAVGRFDLSDMAATIEKAEAILGERVVEGEPWQKLTQAYRKSNLAEATRSLINGLFGEYGLVIIDGDDNELKSLFKEEIALEVNDQLAEKAIAQTNQKLKTKGYKIQVNPRSINGFLLDQNRRDRMDAKDGKLEVIGRKELSDRDVRKMLEDSAAHFSPNAVMRPLYQEKILPNVAYIGGAGEISYWMQLKSMFEDFHIDFPVVMVRSSAWVTSTALEKKLKNMNLQIDDLFGDIDELITSYVRKHDDVNLSHEIKELRRIFSSIHEKALGIEESMNRTVEAEKSKAEKALLQLEKKMISRLKAKHEVEINKIRTMHSKLFPLGKPQERVENLFALTMDPRSLIAEMVKVCNPLEHQFYVVESGA